jgi:lipid-A-disaccharide synthase
VTVARRVFFSSGEASGDVYAAALARALLERFPEIDLSGIGGPSSQAAGIRLIADSREWGAISIVQSLRVGPAILRGYARAKASLRAGTPGLLILIDFGGMNTRLGLYAKSKGWKVFYFSPPGAWKRFLPQDSRYSLHHFVDGVATPFPWSAALLQAKGVDARFFGHPLKEILKQKSVGSGERAGLAILPGSRRGELSENVPAIAESLRGFSVPVTLTLAPHTDPDEVEKVWRHHAGFSAAVVSGETSRVLRQSQAGVICSGTATLEAALLDCPMVIVYRISKMMQMEAKVVGFKRPKFIGLPNILLNREVVPELVDTEATTDAIREAVDALMAEGSEVAERQREGFAELNELLGPDDAISRTADWISAEFIAKR